MCKHTRWARALSLQTVIGESRHTQGGRGSARIQGGLIIARTSLRASSSKSCLSPRRIDREKGDGCAAGGRCAAGLQLGLGSFSDKQPPHNGPAEDHPHA